MVSRSAQAHRQLTLRFPPREAFRLDAFVTGENAELCARLGALAPHAPFQTLWVTGTAGTGKSHLLQGACHAVAARGGLVAYVSARALADAPGALDGLASFDVIAIDDVDDVLGARPAEEALLALYQELTGIGGTLLLSGREVPRALDFALPDLASRLRAAHCFVIRPPDDAGKVEIVRRYAARRGLVLSDEALRFLLQRCSRSLDALLAAVDQLDDAALAAQRRVTVPFIKSVLDL